ncbi:MAG: (2Fe-2S) ferredoxin domain-containing protein [Candidatus Delongbacteria bacterium]|nr:(2Fe-2S) ferredoxin domain-containing protein [Candidatus Delongbacteria bacterium]
MAKLNLNDLRKIKEHYQEISQERSDNFTKKIVVHMGTCGIAAGARDVLNAVMDEIGKRGLKDIAITQSSCIGLCDREPVVTVEMEGQMVRYQLMTPEKIRKVINDHLINGQLVESYLLK